MKTTTKIAVFAGAVAAFLLVSVAGAAAQKANIVYTEGSAKIKAAAGAQRVADIGGTIVYGESVITGKDGLVELTLPNGSDIRVTQNSVFSYSSTGTGKDERSVLATTAGKVSYKLNKAVGKPPVIQTNSMVAGVRGTEFTVFAGRDGSVLLAVTGGIVDVESQGQTVTLNKDEAVEVTPGQAPGEKYVFLGKELDFSNWNQGKEAIFLADPVGGLKRAEAQLAEYQAKFDSLKEPLDKATKELEDAYAQYEPVKTTGDKDAILKFQIETLNPAKDKRHVINQNIRYYALNYLSVRRYVLSNMYMEMKSRYPIARTDEAEAFFKLHAEILARYEEGIVPKLNENDY
jgi:hypothetical protein